MNSPRSRIQDFEVLMDGSQLELFRSAILAVAFLLMSVIPLQNATADSAVHTPRLSATLTYIGNEVNSKGNQTGSTIRSDSQPGYSGRMLAIFKFNDWLSLTGGVSVEHVRLRIAHSLGRQSSEFTDTLWLAGLPIGLDLEPFSDFNSGARSAEDSAPNGHLYFPVTLISKFKLSEDVSVIRCSTTCRSEPSVNPTALFGEVGVGWRQNLQRSAWDFNVSFSQALSDQFEGGATDLRMSGLRFSTGYRW